MEQKRDSPSEAGSDYLRRRERRPAEAELKEERTSGISDSPSARAAGDRSSASSTPEPTPGRDMSTIDSARRVTNGRFRDGRPKRAGTPI